MRWADVVTENFKAGEMDSMGLGYDDMVAWNPQIIFATNSGECAVRSPISLAASPLWLCRQDLGRRVSGRSEAPST